MRLADPKVSPAELRDLLHAGSLWDADPSATAARENFRNTILESVPGAARGGNADRVYIPVESLNGRCDAVAAAVGRLTAELRSASRDGPRSHA